MKKSIIMGLVCFCGKIARNSGAYPGGRGGPSESLILASLSKVKNGALTLPPPPTSIWRPWSFLPWIPSGGPYLCLNGTLLVMLIYLFLFIFFFLFFLYLSFFFFFWCPFSDPGAPKPPPGYTPEISTFFLEKFVNMDTYFWKTYPEHGYWVLSCWQHVPDQSKSDISPLGPVVPHLYAPAFLCIPG